MTHADADQPTVGFSAPPPAGLPTLPGYEILGELGRGGMGVVYRARQLSLNRVVALKMILSGPHAGADEMARFRREAEALAGLQSPHIVAVHAIDEHDGRPFFSLEFCEGGTLAERIAGGLSPRDAAELVEKLARAMHAAHGHGVVHRDLKPANVLLTGDGTPKITDFGLARKLDEAGQTATGAVMGTPSYMAPEQAEGRKVLTPAVDVWALGAVLYECLTGRPPFRAATPLETVLQVLHDDPLPPRSVNPLAPRDLEAICLKCLEKAAGRRYPDALSLADDLRRFLDGEPISVQQMGLFDRLAGAMERVQLQERFASYGSLLLTLAPVMFLPEVWITAVIALKWHPGLLGLGQATRLGLFVFLVGAFRGWRWLPQGPAERQLWAVWCGYLLACIAIGLSQRMMLGFDSADIEARLYPSLAALTALAFFSLAGTFWGYCAVIGAFWMGLALLMALHPPLAPLEYGAAWAAVLTVLGLRLRRLASKARP